MSAATMFAAQIPVMLAAAMAFRLPACRQCGTVMFPPRARCPECLADDIELRVVKDTGVVLATSQLHNSLEPHFLERLPWHIASVKLDAGPVAVVNGAPGLKAGDVVKLEFRPHWKGEGLPVLNVVSP